MGVGMGLFSVVFGVFVLINLLLPNFTLFGYSIGANGGLATLLIFLAFTFSILFLCLGIIGESWWCCCMRPKTAPPQLWTL